MKFPLGTQLLSIFRGLPWMINAYIFHRNCQVNICLQPLVFTLLRGVLTVDCGTSLPGFKSFIRWCCDFGQCLDFSLSQYSYLESGDNTGPTSGLLGGVNLCRRSTENMPGTPNIYEHWLHGPLL